jgi:hypothetical protein
MGGGMFSRTCKYLYITFLIVLQCSLKFFAACCLCDIVQLPPSLLIALWQRKANRPGVNIKFMKNEKLKSTTVRFTDSDLQFIGSLQEKLGLGMIHVIRLAIRRLAESENLQLSNPAPKKR